MQTMGTTGQEVEEEEYSKRDQAVIQLAKLLTTMTGRHPPPGECATLVDLLIEAVVENWAIASSPRFIVEPGAISQEVYDNIQPVYPVYPLGTGKRTEEIFFAPPGKIGGTAGISADQFEQSSSDEIIVEQPKEVGHDGGADREQLQVSRAKGRAAGKVSGNQGEGEGTGILD